MRRNFPLLISLHDCVHFALPTTNSEFQFGKSPPRLQPCFRENAHLGCFFKTKQTEYFLNKTFRQYVSNRCMVKYQNPNVN
ncbi:hypothetical protein H5410_047466 [Solanum commersonii]|uniref:Uncharacterized protein n=1 Tax=Solanum commersonii TaxID=4109 RepID=A0A9J5XJ77_SOLCO|nr:hypothetical protein H5410_047466 [Solanum commersonii]